MDIVNEIFVNFQALKRLLMLWKVLATRVVFDEFQAMELMTSQFLLNIFPFVVYVLLDYYYLADLVVDCILVVSVESCLMAYVLGYLILAVVE